MHKKRIYGVTAVIFLIVGIVGTTYYQKIFGKSVTKNGNIYIRSNADMLKVNKYVSEYLKNPNDFLWLTRKKKFTTPKGGMYLLKKDMSLNDLVNLLKSGQQTPIKITFNNQHTLENLARRIAQQIEADSTAIVNAMRNPTFLSENNLQPKSVLEICIPNSYEFYWNTSAEKFRNRMLKEYHRFWTPNRLGKAKKLQLTKSEVITLASIVQKETAQQKERPIVAGLYLNRLKSGWPLQADPTIIYVLKEKYGNDFIVKRVLNKDLKIDSPYNTYKNKGLPPTLIGMPDISSIDAVLNPEKHRYYYMCASISNIGFHDFARTLAQHNRNAGKYRRWISKKGINR